MTEFGWMVFSRDIHMLQVRKARRNQRHLQKDSMGRLQAQLSEQLQILGRALLSVNPWLRHGQVRVLNSYI